MKIVSDYLGPIEFSASLRLMEEKFNEVVQQKKTYLIGCEHPLTYTAGISTKKEHILKDIPVLKARRGGSVTVHAPGQLIFYTVLPLKEVEGGLIAHIRRLEQVIIETLEGYGLKTFRREGHTGVWTNDGKIAFVALGAKKKCIYHGAAINISNDLADYNPIRSCGLDEPVTNLTDQLTGVEKPTIPGLEEFFNEMVKNWKM